MDIKGVLLATGLSLSAVAGSMWYWAFPEPQELTLPGIVEIQEVRLASKVGGRVVKVRVEENDVVEAGQSLIELDRDELQARREQTAAERDAQQALLDKALNGTRPQECEAQGAAVRLAEATLAKLKAGYRAEEKAEAAADLNGLEGQLVRAKRERDRQVSLRKQKINSQSNVDDTESKYQDLLGRVQAAQARKSRLDAGYRPEEIAEAAAAVDQARAKWDLLKAGTRDEEIVEARARLKVLEARLKELDVQLAETTIVAPSKVSIEVLSVREGDVVAANQAVLRCLRHEDVWVKAYVPETELGQVQRGAKVEVTVDSHPAHPFAGEIVSISSISEFTPRNVQSVDERHHQVFAVKIRVKDPDGIIKSGMAANVRLSRLQKL